MVIKFLIYIKNLITMKLDKNRCKELALLCNTRKEFSKKYGGAYNLSRKNGWIDEICVHMKLIGNLYKRCVYVYEFNDNSIYVGLTFNLEKRNKDHFAEDKSNNSSVLSYIKKTGLSPNLLKITDYIDVELASKIEIETVEYYKARGYKILNRIKAGSIGGNLPKWSIDKCYEAALECCTKTEFHNRYTQAYSILSNNNLLDNACLHMKEIKKPIGYWNNRDVCYNASLKCKNVKEFSKKYSAAYHWSKNNNWIDNFIHLFSKNIPGYWNKEKCKEESLKYKILKDFRINSSVAYVVICNNGWVEELCSHMTLSKKPKGYWTKKKCKEEYIKYGNKSDFYKKSRSSYNISLKNRWLEEFINNT